MCPSQALSWTTAAPWGRAPFWQKPSEGWRTRFSFHTLPLISELYFRFWFLLARSQVLLDRKIAVLDKVRGKPVSGCSRVSGTGDICRKIKPGDLCTLSYIKNILNYDGALVTERMLFTEYVKKSIYIYLIKEFTDGKRPVLMKIRKE